VKAMTSITQVVTLFQQIKSWGGFPPVFCRSKWPLKHFNFSRERSNRAALIQQVLFP